jgi:hypothetical protein
VEVKDLMYSHTQGLGGEGALSSFVFPIGLTGLTACLHAPPPHSVAANPGGGARGRGTKWNTKGESSYFFFDFLTGSLRPL